MSRGFGRIQRLILRALEASQRYEPQGPHQPYEYFYDAQHREYHPGQVVRLSWLTRCVALDVPEGYWDPAFSDVLHPSFKASFSRAMRILKAHRVVLPVRPYSQWVLRAAAEIPSLPQRAYWLQPSDRYVARNPAVPVPSFWGTRLDKC